MIGPDSAIPQAPTPVGLIAGRYAIERELGRGAAAVVYLVRDVKYARQVAVKVLKPEIADSVAKRRFLNEIAVTAALQHPNILAILDSGEVSGLPALDGLPFHVTPYLEGETLRARLQRERQLSIADALAITGEIADALAYAHAHGIIHRDIKPENILFSGRHACVADFGIAHALDCASTDRLTSTGLAVGTPMYMSPEQAAGERDLDARSDIYSLACVLYEMVAGVAPFVGATPATIIAQRFTHAARPLRAYRPNTPEHIEAAVGQAMAITPADRQHTAEEFARTLGLDQLHQTGSAGHAAASMPGARSAPRRNSPLIAAAAGVVVLLGFALAQDSVRDALGFAGAESVASRYVLLPVAGAEGKALTTMVARDRVYDALRRWRDLDLVAIGAVDQVAADVSSLDASLAEMRRLGAGRAVSVQLSPVGDSVQLRATLYDTRGAVLTEHTLRVPDASGAHDRYRELVVTLLRVAPPPPDADGGDQGTELLAAWHPYTRGHVARRAWDLAAAEREFRTAADADPGYAQAQLWSAQIAAWQRPDRPAEWRDAAARADRVPHGDSLLARGLHALATERYPEACETYRQLQRLTPRSDLPWYGLAHCQGYDPVVLEDARSPSGWAFRGSYHAAAQALDSAIARAEGAPTFAFRWLQRVLPIEPANVRPGRGTGSTVLSVAAYPSWAGDTLALVPFPIADFAAGRTGIRSVTLGAALAASANRLGHYLAIWATRSPESADALESLALVQELREERDDNDRSRLLAWRTATDARALSTDSLQQLNLAVTQVRLRIKSGEFESARNLADSILAGVQAPDAEHAERLAGLAALIGRVDKTAELLRLQSPDASARPGQPLLHPAIADLAARLNAYASLGVCSDSILSFERRLGGLLERHVDGGDRASTRRAVLARPISLAVPCLGERAVAIIPDATGRLARMQREWANGQASTIRASLVELQRARGLDRPGDVSLDYTVQEAWLFAAIGDTVAAVRHLELPLSALSTLSARMLDDVPQAAAIGRAMALRAELAHATGDLPAQRLWARSVTELWASADSALIPLLQRMRTLAK